MKHLIASSASHFDYTLIDCAPLLPVTDSAILARLTDGALVVVNAQATTRPQLSAALEAIEAAQGTTLGVVLNKLSPKNGDAYTSQKYGYAAYGSDLDANGNPKPLAPRGVRAVGRKAS
jgi:Mrp family chromosome partitioning ATPase